jgi:hypothetical protein
MATTTIITMEAPIELGNYQNPQSTQANLTSRSSEHYPNEPEEPVIQQLEPVDGGAAAWKVLTAAFVFEALLWGKSCLFVDL